VRRAGAAITAAQCHDARAPRVGGVEEQVWHLIRPRVEQIGRQLAVDRPDLAAMGAYRRLERW
jgi:hypothetical protein